MFTVDIGGVRTLYTGDYSRVADRHLPGADTPHLRPDIRETPPAGCAPRGTTRAQYSMLTVQGGPRCLPGLPLPQCLSGGCLTRALKALQLGPRFLLSKAC
jgi:hypothetical protein